MAKQVDRKYSLFVAGYYDDFNASRAIADDENNPNITGTIDHTVTHFGNSLNGEARLNPRYRYSYKDRVDGAQHHNLGAHEFLTTDTVRHNEDKFEGKAQPSFPDGITQGNRYQFGGDSSLDSFQLFANGYNTAGRYSVHLGNNDPSQGRSTSMTIPDKGSGSLWEGGSAESTSFGSATNIFQYANICSVHVGEVAPDAKSVTSGTASDPFSKAILQPIESVDSGKSFLSINTHIRENMTRRLMSYNANLGASSDNDIFGVRMAWRNWAGFDNGQTTGHSYTIRVGFRKNDYTDADGFGPATPAATYTFTTSKRRQNPSLSSNPSIVAASGLKPTFEDYNPWFAKSAFTGGGGASALIPGGAVDGGYNVTSGFTNSEGETGSTTFPSDDTITSADQTRRWDERAIWNDIEFKFDWTAGTYDVLHDGVVLASAQTIGTNSDTGNSYQATEVFGWELILENSGEVDGFQEVGTDTDYVQITTLLDRVYLWRDLQDPTGIGGETIAINNASLAYRSNGISQCTVTIDDSEDVLNLFKVFQDETNQLQELMLFRDGIDRCLWRGHIEKYTATQQKPGQKDIKLSARDYLAALDRTIPVWEIGQSAQIDETEPVGWRPYESANMIEKLHFGTTALERGTQTLGFKKPNYEADTSSRMRLGSAHPIQIYNEEGGAPDRIYDYIGMTAIKGFQKADSTYTNPQSLASPIKCFSTAHGFVQGESITISGTTNYNGTFTVHDPSTDHFYIDTPYVATGKIQAITNHPGYESTYRLSGLKDYWVLQFDEIYPNPAIFGGTSYLSSGTTTLHNIDWERQYITISDEKVLRGNGVAGQRGKRTDALLADSSTSINGVTVNPRDQTRGNLDEPIKLTTNHTCQHYPQGHASFHTNHAMTITQLDIPSRTNSISTTKNVNCGYHAAIIDPAHPGNPKTGRAAAPGGGFTIGKIPYDSLFRSHSRSLLRGPPTTSNSLTDSFGGACFDATFNFNNSSKPFSQQDWLNHLGWFRHNSQGNNNWKYWSQAAINDLAHGGSEPAGDPITKLYFKTGENINVWDLYIGQRLVIRYGGLDANGNAITIQQGSTTNNWSGGVTLVFEITGYGNMPDPGATWTDGTHYLEVAEITNGGYTATYGDLSNLYANHDDVNGAGVGTAGEVNWYLYDAHDLQYSNEQGVAPLSQAHAVTSVEHRAVHSRWIQDLPRSKWFQMQFGVIDKEQASYGRFGSITYPNAQLSASVTPAPYINGQTLSLGARKIARTDKDTGLDIPEIVDAATNGGVGEIVNPDGTVDAFTFDSLTGYDSSDKTYSGMAGVRFLSNYHASGSAVRIRKISNDFKHCWVLWADMRNDGTANADGGQRKEKFGLLMPMANNYSVSIEFVDSENPDGTPMKFCDLKIGEDFDMWELDATKEPHTQGLWSDLPGASNHEGNPLYHNWENKAGAFVVIDTSKFWNINSAANLGMIGRAGGGRTDLQDYFAVGHGFPIMMDEYWIEAMPTYKTVQAPFSPHPQQMDFIQDGSDITNDQPDLYGGRNRLYLEDVSEWDDTGVGRIIGYSGTGANRTGTTWYYAWGGRNTTDNYLSDVYVQAVGGSTIFPIKTAADRAAASAHVINRRTNYASSQAIFVQGDYDQIRAYNSVAPLSGMRFMMRVSGKVENTNSGTWYDNEKMRFLNMLPVTKNWLGKSQYTGISSFKNVPHTYNMGLNGSHNLLGVRQWNHTGTAFDTFGSVVHAKGSTVYSALVKTQKSTGTGIGGNGQTFTYQIGPDGRIELRPGFNSYFNYDRSVLNISNMNTNIQQRVTHVRVYYNDSKSFCDYPTVTGSENIRWKIMDMPEVGTKAEAEYLAKQEYLKAKKAPVQLNAKVVRGTASDDVMLDGARYGYIADPQRTVYGQHPHFMFGRMNNNFFSGAVNALDGQIKNTGTIDIGSGSRDNAAVNASDEIQWQANNYWYGANSLANAIEVVHVPQNLPKYSMTTGNQLRFVITPTPSSGSTTPTTLEEAARNTQFDLYVIDPIFKDSSSRNASFNTTYGTDSSGNPNLIGEAEWFGLAPRGGTAYTAATTAAGQGHNPSNEVYKKTINLQNGFLEVELPETYAFGTGIVNKIIISINRDYLEALIRKRCGDDPATAREPAHGIPGEVSSGDWITLSTSYNSHSIFPLGCRYYTEFGEGTKDRSIWYAPRLIINDDINFRTGTALTYTDSVYGFTNQPMIINNVNWKINPLRHEEVVLGLSTDESHFLNNLGSVFLTPPVVGDPTPSPSKGGGGSTSGRGDEDGDEGEPIPPAGPPTGPVPELPPGQFPPMFPPGLSGGQTNMNIASIVGINQMSQGIMSRIKGKMNVPVGAGEWGILGQDRPQPAVIQDQVLISNDGAFTPSGGSASLSETGIVLPGRTFPQGDAQQAEYSEVSGIQVIPNNISTNNITISAMIDTAVGSETFSTSSEDGDAISLKDFEPAFAKVTTTVTVLETGASSEQTTVIPTSQNGIAHNLFNNKLEGADVPGNHLEVVITRVAGEDGDTAETESIKLKSIGVTMKTQYGTQEGASAIFDTNVAPR